MNNMRVVQISFLLRLISLVAQAPLEVGFVSFPSFVKNPIQISNNDTKQAVLNKHAYHEWIPGHVRNHAFIPAHVHHIYIPSTAIVASTVLVKMNNENDDYFGSDDFYGGYGVGSHAGGQGAGHGYQVILNP